LEEIEADGNSHSAQQNKIEENEFRIDDDGYQPGIEGNRVNLRVLLFRFMFCLINTFIYIFFFQSINRVMMNPK